MPRITCIEREFGRECHRDAVPGYPYCEKHLKIKMMKVAKTKLVKKSQKQSTPQRND